MKPLSLAKAVPAFVALRGMVAVILAPFIPCADAESQSGCHRGGPAPHLGG
ncbi:MAG: hypothetical protein HY816_02195 [Candidatus Wallbacteria bacterium]|nr:hypothetical protein [Candidatus Wallbacteria bacterium]